jgi:hypothetical protein
VTRTQHLGACEEIAREIRVIDDVVVRFPDRDDVPSLRLRRRSLEVALVAHARAVGMSA